jgi:hypothetical protein
MYGAERKQQEDHNNPLLCNIIIYHLRNEGGRSSSSSTVKNVLHYSPTKGKVFNIKMAFFIPQHSHTQTHTHSGTKDTKKSFFSLSFPNLEAALFT